MTARRTFKELNDTLIDVYGENAARKPVSFQAPVAALRHLRWRRAPVTPIELPTHETLRERRDALRARLPSVPLDELSDTDLRDVRRLADAQSAVALQTRFPEIVAAWTTSNPEMLCAVAAAILSVNPLHMESARSLTSALFTLDHSNYVRAQVAGSLSDAFQIDRETEAMFHLRDALVRVVRADDGVGWAPFAYSCVRHLLRLERSETLRRCEDDLRRNDEWDRGLLLNELAEVPGADVISLVRRHLKIEKSARLRIRAMRMLDDLLPERSRAEIIACGLGDASPSCRFLAIKALQRVQSKTALELARGNLRAEPDVHLRRLLEEVVELSLSPPRTREKRGGSLRRTRR